jgi:site-specific DNA-methyltransferase (adenine-specific)
MLKLLHGDCLELMKDIPDKSIDMILCDLPYGTTACKWDTVIPFEPLWEQYKRIIKDNGAIVLTASQPFTSALVMSNPKWFKYEWIWEKNAGSNFASVRFQPMKEHENVLVFCKGTTTYNQQKQQRIESGFSKQKTPLTFNRQSKDDVYGGLFTNNITKKHIDKLRCPRSIQKFSRERGLHPTQKPVALMEYLIKTYTNENETVLDNCMGSGTTGIACKNINRNFIGIEKDDKYFEIANNRINDLTKQESMI